MAGGAWGAAADGECLQGVAGVGDDQRVAGGGAGEGDACHVARGEEAALPRRDGGEVAVAVSSQPEPVAGVGARRVRLRVVQVAGDDEVEVAVAVDVVDDDASDRRDLRQVGSGVALKTPPPSLCRNDAGEGVRLVVRRLLELRRA